MENHKLVLPGHLNQYGFLFGGNLLKWVDEYAWIAASMEDPGCQFVTIAMDRVELRKSVRQGNAEAGGGEPIFTTHVTFVRIGGQGRKLALPSCPGASDPNPSQSTLR
ncbi:MAG: hypothetical protein M0017_08490 [Desulfobacteraceae bacterium]|nr:hypothetical protein [Desulfobacteraceae bacterium]